MCRLLLVRSEKPFPVIDHLQPFSRIAEESKEYQGHGWGCAFLQNGAWNVYKNIHPIWKDNLDRFGSTTLLMGHARSAFQNEGIRIENNMPFLSGEIVFVFNGELQKVRIPVQGRIGAEKIFNFILRFHKNNLFDAICKGTDIIEKRARYIRAMNMLLSDKKNVYLVSQFNEDPDYFTMHMKKSLETLILCSEPYPGDQGWEKIANHSRKVFP